jgi:TetR/AcrR family transcriptional regulator, regulator of cefoperazone and chloramphenicol sensitivity
VRTRTPGGGCADEPRKRLIEAGLDLFGKRSFDGTGTRLLAERAEVNLAAIKYYFGGKEGLYLAVARHIVDQMNGLLGPRLAKIQEALRKQELSKEESFHLFCELVDFFISRFLGDPDTEKWLSIIIREQLCPTEAFGVLFEGFMKPLDQAFFGLAARITGRGGDDPDVRIRVFSVMGEILMFHISPSAVKRTLNWEDYGPENLDAIRRVIMRNIQAIFSMSSNAG